MFADVVLAPLLLLLLLLHSSSGSLNPFSSRTVPSVSFPPLLLSLLTLLFAASFSSPAEFIFSEVMAVLPKRYPLVLYRVSSVLL
jgi:hypothetical protein